MAFKVAIVGSRNFKDEERMFKILDAYLWTLGSFEVITGGARGADTLAMKWANSRKEIPVPVVHSAYWNDISHPDAKIRSRSNGKKYDANAGFRRNKLIVNDADILIAFWDGRSRGTKHSIELAKEKGILTIVVTGGKIDYFHAKNIEGILHG